jgi:hypothetical protein
VYDSSCAQEKDSRGLVVSIDVLQKKFTFDISLLFSFKFSLRGTLTSIYFFVEQKILCILLHPITTISVGGSPKPNYQ